MPSLVRHESSSPSISVKPPIFCCNGDLITTKLHYVSPTFAPPCVVYDAEGWPKVQATLCVIQPLVHIYPLPREFNPYSRSECSHIFFYITSIGLVRMTSNKKNKTFLPSLVRHESSRPSISVTPPPIFCWNGDLIIT
jgi:hypothetical protein